MVLAKSTSTAERILDVAQDIIQKRGYCDMTLQEVAEGVGISKPSIIHYFTGKASVGEAVIRRYRANIAAALDTLLSDPSKTASEALDFYFAAYLGYGTGGEEKVCLCGALASEFHALPNELKDELRLFFEHHQDWLETILIAGTKSGEFQFEGKPRFIAQLFLDALQGSLLIGRATGRDSHVRDTVRSLKASIEFAGRPATTAARAPQPIPIAGYRSKARKKPR